MGQWKKLIVVCVLCIALVYGGITLIQNILKH